MFEFLHYTNLLFSDKVVESQAWDTEHCSFDRHGLAVADIECSESHNVVYIKRIDMKSILLELRFEFSFGGDIYLPMG